MVGRVCNSSACQPLSYFSDDDDNEFQDMGQSVAEPTTAATQPHQKAPAATSSTTQGFLGRLNFSAASSAAVEALPTPIPSSEGEGVNMKRQPPLPSQKPAAPAASQSFLGFGRLSLTASRAVTEALNDEDEELIHDNDNVKVTQQLKKPTHHQAPTPKLSVEDKLVLDKIDAIMNDEAFQELDKQEKISHLLQAMLSDKSRREIAHQAFYKMEKLQENAYMASLFQGADLLDAAAGGTAFTSNSKNNSRDVNDEAYNTLKGIMVPTTITVKGATTTTTSSSSPNMPPRPHNHRNDMISGSGHHRGRKAHRQNRSDAKSTSSRSLSSSRRRPQHGSSSNQQQRSKSMNNKKAATKKNWMEPL